MGLARAGGRAGIAYDWGSIYDLWIVRPESSLVAFAKWIEIPYETLKDREEFSADAKADLVNAAASTWRDAMYKTLAVRSFGDPEAASRSMSEMIRDMQEATAIAASFARGRMVKIDSNGRPIANATLPTIEVVRCMEIISKCSNTLRNLVETRRVVIDSIPKEHPDPIPRRRVENETPPPPAPPPAAL